MRAVEHPGELIRREILPAGITVKDAAAKLGVGRPALSNLLNGNASLSADMAVRLEKAFGADRSKLLASQADYDAHEAKEREGSIAVRAYTPSLLLISAGQIEAWSETGLHPREELAVLLRHLVRSTGKSLAMSNFPGGANSQRPGWDGEVETDEATAWIPRGKSGWEFGCDKDPQDKANGDYQQRTKSVHAGIMKETTLVFVTPRNWKNAGKWAAAKRAEGKWKDVRAYDASDLEQWLEDSIPAQAWMSERLPVAGPKRDIFSLDYCLAEWKAATEPRLNDELFRPALDEVEPGLKSWLESAPQKPFVVTSESTEEALAFLACALSLETLPPGSKEKALVLQSGEATERAQKASTNFIAVLASDSAQQKAGDLPSRQHTIVVTRRNAVEGDPDIHLDIVDAEAFKNGLAAMGLPDDEIEQLRHESGQSLTVLRRRLAVMPAVKVPPWAEERSTARQLLPLMFVGAWGSEWPADKMIIAELAGRSYEDVEVTVAGLLGGEQSPVWSIGRLRGVVSKVDGLYALNRFVIADDLKRFFSVARIVLSEEDPALDLPQDQRWAAGIHGKTRRHSGALRQGICETLVFLGCHGNELFKTRLGIDVKGEVDALIRSLLTPLEGATWESQVQDLPRYAEAAPEVFLSVLEGDLKSATPKVLALLRPADAGGLSGCPRTGLLWALENVAWSPKWFPRVVDILARLSEVEITDNWTNRPVNSLASLFRSWMPQTAATLDMRKRELTRLAQKYPKAAWRICLDQFGRDGGFATPNHRPRWRVDARGAGAVVTNQQMVEMNRAAFEIALAWPSHDEKTLSDLIEQLQGLPEEDQDRVWAQVEEWIASGPTDEQRATLRERLRINTLTRRGKRKGDRIRARARAVYDALEPTDVIKRHAWLFANAWVDESADELEDDVPYQDRQRRIDELRLKAINQVWSLHGMPGVMQLVSEGGADYAIGLMLEKSEMPAEEKEELPYKILTENEPLTDKIATFLMGYMNGHADRRLPLMQRTLDRLGEEDGRLDDQVRLLTLSEFGETTWAMADSIPGAAERYWKTVVPGRHLETEVDANRCVEELLNADRPRAAFAAVGYSLELVDSRLLVRLMIDVATKDVETSGHYPLAAHNISEGLKELNKRADVPRQQRAQLEFMYIRSLEFTEHRFPNLEEELAEAPVLFVQMLAMVFKREDDGEDPPELTISDAERASGLASAAYHLLTHMQRTPGTQDGGVVDSGALRRWIKDVLDQARDVSRERMANSRIGDILGRSTVGEDGLWPREAIRDALEEYGNETMLDGLRIGVYNKRGVHTRGPGGEQERVLAKKYRDWALALDGRYPVTERALEMIAAMYDAEAIHHDQDEKVRRRLLAN